MSDFTSNFWSVFVAAISILGILYCAVLLWVSSKIKVSSHNTQDGTTGHVWDENLREMNNPLPRWWLWLFIITIVFAVVYGLAYPGLGSFAGKLGWSSQGQYDAEVAKANQELEPMYAAFNAQKPEQLAGDPKAMAVGERLFMNNCAQCHGSDARGSKSFPNLTDQRPHWSNAPHGCCGGHA
jgi:cytochrome c oxidase cbb3-type subunit 3